MAGPHSNGTRAALVLASGSATRKAMLERAGLDFEVIRSGIDEEAVRQALLMGDDPAGPEDLAMILARTKADDVSAGAAARAGGRPVIAADQVLVFEGEVLGKPATREIARDRLLAMRGKPHELHTAAVLLKGPDMVWETSRVSRLRMRDFSPQFLGAYLAAEGDGVLETVGGYRVEGRGIQLFEAVDGDHSDILGLPLLPLLAALRAHGMIAE